MRKSILCLALILAPTLLLPAKALGDPGHVDRALFALPQPGGSVYLGWRFLLCDGAGTVFYVYRRSGDQDFVLIGTVPDSSNYLDETTAVGEAYEYVIRAVVDGWEGPESNTAPVETTEEGRSYFSIPTGAGTKLERLVAVDLDGDGFLDYVFIWPKWPSGGEQYKMEAVLHDGTHLYTYLPGIGVTSDESVHSAPFTAWDLDGDDRAEVILRTSKSSSSHDFTDDYLTVIDGLTSEVKMEVKWIDRVGNNNEDMRNALAIAYLDGSSPSIIVGRGTYHHMKVAAFDTNLVKLWETDLNSSDHGSASHMMEIADFDGDGNDEIFWGNILLSEDGTVLWTAPNSTSYPGHPDLLYVADIRPDIPGLELLLADECWSDYPCAEAGLAVYRVADDPNDGYTLLWKDWHKIHLHVGFLGDFSAEHDGMEVWASGSVDDGQGGRTGGVHNAYGEVIDVGADYWGKWPAKWDEESPMALVTGGWHLWDYDSGSTKDLSASGYSLMRGGVIADVIGDSREELIRQSSNGSELRIFTNTQVSSTRRVTLLLDRKYRGDMARTALQYERQVFEGGYYFAQNDCPQPPEADVQDLPDGGADGGSRTHPNAEVGPEDGTVLGGCACAASADSSLPAAPLSLVLLVFLVLRRARRQRCQR
jgi:MYXO-CTERM domain-containing protein